MEKRKQIHSERCLTKQLLNQLNENAWNTTKLQHHFHIRRHNPKPTILEWSTRTNRTEVEIPLLALKTWTTQKFFEVFERTMNSQYYEIIFV